LGREVYDEISKRKVCESIAEVKDEDSEQKNERKMRKNDGELDDYNEEAKTCDDDGHEGDKQMKLDDETTDLNDSFLDSGQVDNKEEDSASGFRREVEEMIENDVETKETDFELEKHENEEKCEFGREIERDRRGTMNKTIDYDEEKRNSERIMEKDEELTEICDFKVGEKDDSCETYKRVKELDADAKKMQMSVFCVIFVKLIAVTKEMMRRHDARLFEVDDDRRNEKVKKSRFSSDDWTRDWNERLWTSGVMSRVFKIERHQVRMTDSKSWRLLMRELVRNGMTLKCANAFMRKTYLGRTMIQKFTRMKVVLDIG